MNLTDDECLNALRRRLSRYGPLTEATFLELAAYCRVESYPADTELLRIGEVAINRYYLYSGLLVSIFDTKGGMPHLKNFFVQDDFAGSVVSLLRGTPSAFGLRTLEATTVVAFDNAVYRRLATTRPDLNTFYLRHLEDSWIVRNEARQLAFATQTATERYTGFLAEYPDLEQRIPQYYIAAYLGITPTQLSRIRQQVYQNDQI